MPLIKSGSKKAFEKNVKTEMDANPDKKDKAQNLAIAYNVQKQARKKKFAEGGVAETAPAEHMVDESSVTPEEMKMIGAFRAHVAKGGTSDNFRMEGMSLAGKEGSEKEMDMMAEGGVAGWTDGRDTIDENQNSMSQGRNIAVKKQGLRATDADQREIAMMARGGKVSPEDEIEDEHHASIAAAIMAKRKKMADGGEVDLKWNGAEHLNKEDELSFNAARKNRIMGDDIDEMDQPMDSNEDARKPHDDDEHDMIGKIRAKMKMRKM